MYFLYSGFFLFFCSIEASFENIRYNEKTASQVALVVKNLSANAGELGLDPWVRKIPWKRAQKRTPVFWPGEFHGLYNSWGYKESDTTERFSLSFSQKKDLFKDLKMGRCMVCQYFSNY